METAERTVLSAPRFAVAKYVPDPRRMEPKNFGIILWAPEGVEARFLGEADGKTRPPAHLHVRSDNAYRQWIEYWRGKIERGAVVRSSGEKVHISEPQFLTELLIRSKEQFMLVEGGVISSRIQKDELADVADDLFSELVLPPPSAAAGPRDREHQEAARTLKRSAKLAIENASLDQRKDFFPNYNMTCKVGSTLQHFAFDYAIHPGRPAVLMDELPLWKLESVQSTAYRFGCMQAAYGIPAKKCASLVYATEKDMQQEAIQQALKLMESLSTVINVSDPELAGDRLLALVA